MQPTWFNAFLWVSIYFCTWFCSLMHLLMIYIQGNNHFIFALTLTNKRFLFLLEHCSLQLTAEVYHIFNNLFHLDIWHCILLHSSFISLPNLSYHLGFFFWRKLFDTLIDFNSIFLFITNRKTFKTWLIHDTNSILANQYSSEFIE